MPYLATFADLFGAELPDAAGQLYNLREDLAETKNLYKEHPEIVTRLTAEMQKVMMSGRSR